MNMQVLERATDLTGHFPAASVLGETSRALQLSHTPQQASPDLSDLSWGEQMALVIEDQKGVAPPPVSMTHGHLFNRSGDGSNQERLTYAPSVVIRDPSTLVEGAIPPRSYSDAELLARNRNMTAAFQRRGPSASVQPTDSHPAKTDLLFTVGDLGKLQERLSQTDRTAEFAAIPTPASVAVNGLAATRLEKGRQARPRFSLRATIAAGIAQLISTESGRHLRGNSYRGQRRSLAFGS